MEFIYGQGNAPHGALPYGKRDIRRCGCGAVALYNALLLLGRRDFSLQQITAWLEQRHYLVLGGRLGTRTRGILRFLKNAGYRIQCTCRTKTYAALARQADACILKYYWLKKGRLGAHYVVLAQGEYTGCYYNVFPADRAVRLLTEDPRAFLKSQGACLSRCILIFKKASF